ncbi:OsmC family protein [Enterovibrio baiacu]|uniref:OsmC family protein n=1 Tax=Enterovibrio baiacu TaxID=2491023 RepID=UPI0010127EF9|nr:OsmC family protein [Enterovibrio baiacu]MBE1276598.1 OsmC family peroxiredoxin [Enterovibrio baiacu]
MTTHSVLVQWEHSGQVDAASKKVSFVHQWTFDGGITVDASPSPLVMPLVAKEDAIDPEEAFIAAIASCHMMTFLTVAEKQRFVVESYRDNATGTLGENAEGRTAITDVVLRPTIRFSGDNTPSSAMIDKMHKLAHKHCFIANSVSTNIVIEAQS